MIEQIWAGKQPGELMAIWVHGKTEDWEEGCRFFTPSRAEQQVGYMKYREGHEIEAHRHYYQVRTLSQTSETLIICKGQLAFHLYEVNGDPVFSGTAVAGDVLILLMGAHGFQALTDVEFLEVKTGPHKPNYDKTPLFPKEIANVQ